MLLRVQRYTLSVSHSFQTNNSSNGEIPGTPLLPMSEPITYNLNLPLTIYVPSSDTRPSDRVR